MGLHPGEAVGSTSGACPSPSCSALSSSHAHSQDVGEAASLLSVTVSGN